MRALRREDFYQRYRGVSPEGLVLWMDQCDARSYGTTSAWKNLAGRDQIEQDTSDSRPNIGGVVGFGGHARVFDGTDDYMHQKVYDDETGASFWAIDTGGTPYLGAIFANGSAAFRCEGVDLSPFASAGNDYVLIVKDSSNNVTWGYIDLADSAVAYSSVIDDDCADDDTADWSKIDCTLAFDTDHYEVTRTNSTQYIYQKKTNMTAGKIYRFQADIKNGSAADVNVLFQFADGSGNPWDAQYVTLQFTTTANWQTCLAYFIAEYDSNYVRFYSNFASDNYEIKNITLDEVTHVGTDGVLIMSTNGGSTQNWASIDASFDYNDSSGYTFQVIRSDFFHQADLSYVSWLQHDDGQPSADEVLFAKGEYTTPLYAYSLKNKTTGKLEAITSSDGTTAEGKATDAAVFSNGAQTTFDLVGFTYDNAQAVALYDDGAAKASSNLAGGGPPTSLNDMHLGLTIGAGNDAADPFTGKKAVEMLFTRKLSAAEMQRIYLADGPRFGKLYNVSAPSWSPDDLADMICWYKTDDMVYSDGDEVSWTDVGPDGVDLTAPTAYSNADTYAGPTYQDDAGDKINNIAVVRFTQGVGTYQALYNPTENLGSGYVGAVFAVIKCNSSTGLYTCILSSTDESGDFTELCLVGTINISGANYAWIRVYSDGIIDQSHRGNTELVDDTAYYITWRIHETAPSTFQYSIRVNGVLQSLTKVTGDANDGSWFGNLINRSCVGLGYLIDTSPTYGFHGDIAEVFAYEADLSDSDIANAESYLSTRYSL